MDERKQRNKDPWDDAVYGTGNTQPPKSYGGLIAALLVVVIFLSGIVSALGLLNIRLFRELNQMNEEIDSLPISFSDTDADVASASISESYTEPLSTQPTTELRTSGEVTLNIQPSPESMENISQEGGLSWQDIYNRNIPSVASITVMTPHGNTTGTGVVLTRDGYIVTNSHVLEDAQEITVLLSDDRSFSAWIAGDDPVSDLAVLGIDANDLTAAEFGDSDALRVGDAVAAIGDPLGLELRGTLTDGIISAINRDVTVNGRTMTLLQTNAALNTGNSGGPLVNCYGQVIGINTMKISAFTDAAGVEGLGFAIPSTTVKDIVDQLIHQGYVSGRPTLGIAGESVQKFDQYYYGIPAGLHITHVMPGSPAASMGVLSGDILISLNGMPIPSQEALDEAVYALNVGDTVDAVLFRNGAEFTVSLTLTENKG